MRNKKCHFNHKNLFENNYLINDQSFLMNYSNNFNKLILPNPNSIFKNWNNIISNEQSTFLSSEDCFIKNRNISKINNCKCFCHKIDRRVIKKLIKVQMV